MKKMISLMLCMFLVCAAGTALADYKAGDTVTISVSVSNPNGAVAFDVYFSYDSTAFRPVGATGANGVAGGTNGFVFVDFSLNPFSGGSIGTATFEVLSGAVPGKSYSISAYNAGAYDAADNEVAIFVSTSGGSVSIKPAACTTHVWNSGEVTAEATCAAEGMMRYTCTNSGCTQTKTEAIPKLTTHSWDNGSITTQPTCTKDGVKTFTCSVCKGTKTETVAAAGHVDGAWGTTSEATCTADGEKSLTCAVCGDTLEAKTIPATGHTEGKWVTVKESTCKENGSKEQRCTVCSTVLAAETIPAADAAHKPGNIVVTIAATCTEAGEQTRRCTVCGEVLETEKIPATGHDEGRWITVKPATREETGLKELHCTKCDELLDTAVIPMKTTEYYAGNTVCSIGPRFRDESALTDDWYRFTPVDLSADGVQTFELIASDTYIIGQVTVTIADGMVTIDYAYVSDDVVEHSAFFTLLPSITETVTLDQEQLTSCAFGQPVSIAEALKGDTKVLLFVCNVVDYNTDMPITHVYPNSDDYLERIDLLRMNMD